MLGLNNIILTSLHANNIITYLLNYFIFNYFHLFINNSTYFINNSL